MAQPHRAGLGQETGSNITATHEIDPNPQGLEFQVLQLVDSSMYTQKEGAEGGSQALGLILFLFGCKGCKDGMDFKSVSQAQKILDDGPR